MTNKIRVGVLFGGKSAEHEVSLQSAKNVVNALDKEKYEVILIGIDKEGQWYLNDHSQFLLNADNPKLTRLNQAGNQVVLAPGKPASQLLSLRDHKFVGEVDVIFPVLHGPFGEDGTIQGLLKLADIPFVGAGVLGSAVCMDKDVMKRLLRDAGLPVAKFRVFQANEQNRIDYSAVTKALGTPVFVKPANLGSSVGINKAATMQEFDKAVSEAFRFDRKILIEEFVPGREIECSVLGNDEPIASLPGEIIVKAEFYSYEAKYIDENGATLEFPAKLSAALTQQVQELAVKTYQTLCCEGMARVDFFLRSDGQIFVNELNSIPGFTKISMYPKLWEISGIGIRELIDRLIGLALDRHEKEKRLQTSYQV